MRTSLTLVLILVALAQAPVADAKTVTMNASANLHITVTHGSRMEAQGAVSGTFTGTLQVRATLGSGSQMTATFVAYSRAGTLRGTVTAEYYPSGSVNIYTGSVGVGGGTGSYAHARSRGVSVHGTVSRARRLITMRLSGRLSE